MKNVLLPHAGILPFAASPPSLALIELEELLLCEAAPEGLVITITDGTLDALLNKVTQLTDRAIREPRCYCFMFAMDIKVVITETWKLLIRLLDLVSDYLKSNTSLTKVYQQIQSSLLKTYEEFEQIHASCCPAGNKMSDLHLHREIKRLKSNYENIITANKGNGLLKALLHPVYDIIKYPGKGNNTYEKVHYANILLANIKLWRTRGAAQGQLYQIALAMNLNSALFMGYLSNVFEQELEACDDPGAKAAILHKWNRLYLKSLSGNQWRHPAQQGYNPQAPVLSATVQLWLKHQKSLLELGLSGADMLFRVEFNGDSAFFAWSVKIATQAGAFKTPVVAHSIRAMGQGVSFPRTGIPSISNLEQLSKGEGVRAGLKKQLVGLYGNCYHLALNLDVKTSHSTSKAKRKTK